MKAKILVTVLLLFAFAARSQPEGASKPIASEYPYFASLAPNGILFQWSKNKSFGLYILRHGKDTISIPIPACAQPQHPVWVPGKNAIVYDSGTGKNSRLFYINIKTGEKKPLISRRIACREASFTPSRHLVAFSGFDDRTQRWQIFSYDFIYDNLNRLTAENGTCRFPVFSPDGKTILYTFLDASGRYWLKSINWYGNNRKTLAGDVYGKACWTPDNWHVLFVVHDENRYLLKSIHPDGSGTTELFAIPYPACCPVEDKSGNIWLSVKPGKKYFLTEIKKMKDTVVRPSHPARHKQFP